MTARVVRHSSGVVSIEPVDAELEEQAVGMVLRVFGDSVVAIHHVDIEEAKTRHPSYRRARSQLRPSPRGTAA